MHRFAGTLLAGFLAASALIAEPVPNFQQAVVLAQRGETAAASAAFMSLAQTGHVVAQANLAVLYAGGVGLPQNEMEAAYWAWRARLGGETRAAGLGDRLLARLTPEMATKLAKRLTQSFTEFADAGDSAALLALGRIAAEVHQPPRPKDALVLYIVAAAFDVPHAGALRDAAASELDMKTRLAAQQMALDLFRDHCSKSSVQDINPICVSTQN